MIGIQDSGLHESKSLFNFSWWGRSYVALQHLNYLDRQYYSGNAIYKACAGALFSAFRGKRIGIVGAKAGLFKEHFYFNNKYREAFPFLELDQWDLTTTIVTPDFHQGLFESRESIERELRRSYGNVDVYLFACGTLAKYLSVQVLEEAGVSGIDIGGALSAMINTPPTRPFMEIFETFEHADKYFSYDGYVVTSVNDRSRTPS